MNAAKTLEEISRSKHFNFFGALAAAVFVIFGVSLPASAKGIAMRVEKSLGVQRLALLLLCVFAIQFGW